MGRKSNKNGECAYCGKVEKLTEDHVIPKCLFQKPNPPQMIKVSACVSCNNLKSKDDDYLRDLLVNDIYSANNQIAQNNIEKFFRSSLKNLSDFSRQIIPRARSVPFQTDGGIYLGEVFALPIDTERVSKIFSRIVYGLYFWEYKKRLPLTYKFKVERITADGLEFEINVLKELQFKHKKYEDVFTLIYLKDVDDQFITKWWLVFYDAVIWTVETHPPQS